MLQTRHFSCQFINIQERLWATSSGTKVRTIVTKVKVKLRHLNFYPYPSRTRGGP